jgi:hypothetical protein
LCCMCWIVMGRDGREFFRVAVLHAFWSYASSAKAETAQYTHSMWSKLRNLGVSTSTLCHTLLPLRRSFPDWREWVRLNQDLLRACLDGWRECHS